MLSCASYKKMSDIIKKDVFITLKSKYWWMLLVICASFICMFVAIKGDQTKIEQQQMNQAIETFTETGYILAETEDTIFAYCEFIFCSDILLMFVVVFSVILVLQELHSGYIKNTWQCIKIKAQYFIAKQILLAMYVFIIFLMSFILVTICGKVFIGIEQFGEFKSFLPMVIKQFILEFSFGTFTMCMALLIRKQVGVLIGAIIYVAVGQTMIYSVIDLSLHEIFKIDKSFKIGKYLIYGNIERITMGVNTDDSCRAMIIAIVTIFIFSVISYFTLNKRDIV